MLTMAILIHAIYSAMRWRKFLLVSNEDGVLPMDVHPYKTLQVIVELGIGIVMCVVLILSNTRKFKKVR